MANVMLKCLDGPFWYESKYPDIPVPAFNVRVFTSDLKVLNWSSRHSNTNFAHSSYFYCLTNIAKTVCEKYRLVVGGLFLL